MDIGAQSGAGDARVSNFGASRSLRQPVPWSGAAGRSSSIYKKILCSRHAVTFRTMYQKKCRYCHCSTNRRLPKHTNTQSRYHPSLKVKLQTRHVQALRMDGMVPAATFAVDQRRSNEERCQRVPSGALQLRERGHRATLDGGRARCLVGWWAPCVPANAVSSSAPCRTSSAPRRTSE